MEKELRESVEFPWLLCRIRYEKEQVFCSASQPHHTFRDRIPVLWNKLVGTFSYGWMLLVSADECHCMLFNPNTRLIIDLPVLLTKPRRNFNAYILWLSPENPMSKVLLFDSGRSSIEICNIHKKQWIEVSYKAQVKNIVEKRRFGSITISDPVICNGRLYALLPSRPYKLVEIDILEETGASNLQIKSLESEIPLVNSHSSSLFNCAWWLVESEGELFAINVVFGGVDYAEVFDAGVFRWDFSSQKQGWRDVKGSEMKDRVFFLGLNNQHLSCTTRRQKLEGGRVYFIRPGSKCLYSFIVEDGSVTVSLPSTSSYPSVWLMMSNSREQRGETLKTKKASFESSSECKSIDFLGLPYDIMETVARKLRPMDLMNLRATCRGCCPLTPQAWWKTGRWVSEETGFLPPWLMFSRSDRKMHHFIDIKFGGMFTMESDGSLHGAKIRYSRDGWVLMTNIGENMFFFYNPFTKEVIKLPEAPEHAAEYDSFCFTDIPSSRECIVMGVTSGSVVYFDTRQQQWSEHDRDDFFYDMAIHNNPAFFKGAFYILGSEGDLYKLSSFEENSELIMFDSNYCPCEDFYQNFLLEWNGKLASVFISDLAHTSLQVFTLNETTMVWEEVLSLGKSSFFLSSFSTFSITIDISEMQNKIYFSKIYGEDKIIFYCLETRRFGYTMSMSQKKIKGLRGAKEYFSSCWIQPSLASCTALSNVIQMNFNN